MRKFYGERLVFKPEVVYPDQVGVDATPDDEYPIRILEAYRAMCDTQVFIDTDGTEDEFCRIMNEAGRERARILDAALLKLRKQNS